MNETNKGLSITDLLNILWLNKFLILTLACLFATFFLIKTVYFSEPQYMADGMLYVSNKDNVIIQDAEINQSDIISSRSLGYTYIEILKSRSFLTEVSEATGGHYSWKNIKSMLTVSSLNETELLSISVKANNSEDACNIARAVLDKAPGKLKSILNGGAVEIVDPIAETGTLVDAGIPTKTVFGFVIGAFLGFAIAFLRNLFDKKVHKGEDVAKRYNVSILGNIGR